MSKRVDTGRLIKRIEHLAGLCDPSAPAYTRRAFTPIYLEARHWLREQFQAVGAHVSIDAGGNLVARIEGRIEGRKSLPPLMTGSHIDTVVGGGRFDGIAGVLAGLEVAEVLAETGMKLRHPLEVVDFLSEEPSDFGVSCIGSQAVAGTLTHEALKRRNPAGESLADAITRMGGRPAEIGNGPLRNPGSIAAFVELHIEQGPVLEREGYPVGIVTDIVGIQRFEAHLRGRADHAGTTPMHMRRDALVAAAEVIQLIHALSRSRAYAELVATVGKLEVRPNASNVVPGAVDFSLDVRSPSQLLLDRFGGELRDAAAAAITDTGVTLEWDEMVDSPPRRCDPHVQDAIERACRAVGYRFRRMSSGAGHDAAHMSALAPMGMIFIPCREGRSHAADEWVEPADIAAGAETVLETVLQLDGLDPA